MTLLDMRSKEEWESILDEYSKEVNMTACLGDDTAAMLFCKTDRYPLCAAIRNKPEATSFICAQTNLAMMNEIVETNKPAFDMCEIGLLRTAVPVLKDGKMVGQVVACGIAPKDEEIDTFYVAKQLDCSEEEAEELAKSTPFGSEEELKQSAEKLFQRLNSK
jgi:ligand-binding sensor protein